MQIAGVTNRGARHIAAHSVLRTFLHLLTLPVPMFRDLVAHSPDCEDHRYRVDLQKVTELVRNHDAQPTHSQVQSLKLAGVVFHESRCGSTLVANALIGMNPSKHRVYSESAPPISALKLICGETYDTCSMEAAARILQDVIYLMSRSNDDKEERVFFKIQSVGTRNIPVFQHAFPQIPWIFVYRHPVEVLMSQLAQGPRYANCVRPRSSPPTVVKNIVTKSGFSSVKEISDEEYCAAHLVCFHELSSCGRRQQLSQPCVSTLSLSSSLLY